MISLHSQGENITSIVDRLALEDGVKVSKQGVQNFLKRYVVHESIDRKAGSGCPSKITPAIKCIIEDAMRRYSITKQYLLHMVFIFLWLLQHGQGIKWAGSIGAQHTVNL